MSTHNAPDITVEELNNLLRESRSKIYCRTSADLSAAERAEIAAHIRETQDEHETASEANSRIQRFITQRLRAGQLVFDRHTAEDQYEVNVDEITKALSVMLYAVERHATVIIAAKSSRNDGIKRQIFAATPIPDRGILRRTRHRAEIVAIATQAGFTQLRKP
ncbi:hypothetical protein B2J88_50895 [Rhodococcus sp. SRB_17]|nr:hypothetical protein [Rhodococcus sp. SRB_17]